MWGFHSLVVGVICPVCVTFVIWIHSWVALIYVVNVVADVIIDGKYWVIVLFSLW